MVVEISSQGHRFGVVAGHTSQGLVLAEWPELMGTHDETMNVIAHLAHSCR